MRNPFYIKHITRLVDVFVEIDTVVDEIECTNGSIEHLQLRELSSRLHELIPLVDTVPLPASAKQAARNVGDFFYLLQDLADKTLEESGDVSMPTVWEVRKYSDNSYDTEVILDSDALKNIYVYREKARETLRKTANTYGQSCEKQFSTHSEDFRI